MLLHPDPSLIINAPTLSDGKLTSPFLVFVRSTSVCNPPLPAVANRVAFPTQDDPGCRGHCCIHPSGTDTEYGITLVVYYIHKYALGRRFAWLKIARASHRVLAVQLTTASKVPSISQPPRRWKICSVSGMQSSAVSLCARTQTRTHTYSFR